jgi:hypothetical protein
VNFLLKFSYPDWNKKEQFAPIPFRLGFANAIKNIQENKVDLK